MPSSLSVISAPPASKIISAALSSVMSPDGGDILAMFMSDVNSKAEAPELTCKN